MIRTSIIPKEQSISITIPENYVGKKIEVLLYAIEELNDEEKPLVSSGAARFKNIFSAEEGKDFNAYTHKPEPNGTEIFDRHKRYY